ncbi:MAG: hypothetical protein AAB664_01600 [Patescibacteria group bacterium]
MLQLRRMQKQKLVLFVGAGEIGSSLAKLVTRSGVCVEQYDTDVKKVPHQKSLEESVPKAQVIFLCVPSWILRTALKSIVPFLKSKTICVFVSKGIEMQTKFFIDRLAKDILPKDQPIVLLFGPMLAEELDDHLGGAACVGTLQKKYFHVMQHLFLREDLHLTFASDIKSVAIAGVLKNVYAIALGISAGLQWGDNRKGWLCSEALQEMMFIMKVLRGNPSYILSQAGVGDFIATGMSTYSSNHSLGRELAEQTYCERKSEGCQALPTLVKMLGKASMKSLPILTAVHKILEKKKKTKETFETLFCG